MPDDKAPKTKYLTPDSDDLSESLLIAATTYNAKLWSSIPKYIEMRSFEEIKTIIPMDENNIKIGISKRESLEFTK